MIISSQIVKSGWLRWVLLYIVHYNSFFDSYLWIQNIIGANNIANINLKEGKKKCIIIDILADDMSSILYKVLSHRIYSSLSVLFCFSFIYFYFFWWVLVEPISCKNGNEISRLINQFSEKQKCCCCLLLLSAIPSLSSSFSFLSNNNINGLIKFYEIGKKKIECSLWKQTIKKFIHVRRERFSFYFFLFLFFLPFFPKKEKERWTKKERREKSTGQKELKILR